MSSNFGWQSLKHKEGTTTRLTDGRYRVFAESNSRGVCVTAVDDEAHLEHLIWIPANGPIATETCNALSDSQRDEVLKNLGAHVA